MTETVDEFFDRTYWNGITGIVLVYPSKRMKDDTEARVKPKKWSIEKAQNYVEWLLSQCIGG